MTNELASEILKNIQAGLSIRYKGETFEKCNDALNKAIDSLQTPNIFREFVFKAIKTEIPPNATNGDVIKALFPTTTMFNDCCGDIVYRLNHDLITFGKKWWNEPYKAESESKQNEVSD